MKWLVWNDIKYCLKYISLYFIMVIFGFIQDITNLIYYVQGLIYFYCIVLSLHSSLVNNIVYFYTLFPKKRYFLILQKNITILILDLLFNLTYHIFLPNSDVYIIDNIMSYWLIGSIISFYFFQFKISYANSLLQLTLYGIAILAYIFNEFTSKISFNWAIVLMFGVIINLLNIILYRNKNFVTNYYKY